MVNYYHILGLNKHAEETDIRQAYKRLAVVYHPDKLHNLGEELQRLAQARMLIINEAYRVLSDKEKRVAYDLSGEGKGLKQVFCPHCEREIPAELVGTESLCPICQFKLPPSGDLPFPWSALLYLLEKTQSIDEGETPLSVAWDLDGLEYTLDALADGSFHLFSARPGAFSHLQSLMPNCESFWDSSCDAGFVYLGRSFEDVAASLHELLLQEKITRSQVRITAGEGGLHEDSWNHLFISAVMDCSLATARQHWSKASGNLIKAIYRYKANWKYRIDELLAGRFQIQSPEQRASNESDIKQSLLEDVKFLELQLDALSNKLKKRFS